MLPMSRRCRHGMTGFRTRHQSALLTRNGPFKPADGSSISPVGIDRHPFAIGEKGNEFMSNKRSARGPSQRQLRVGEELRHALAEVLRRGDFRDPELQNLNVTVTEVRISPDLRNATAFITPLGGGQVGETVARHAPRRRLLPRPDRPRDQAPLRARRCRSRRTRPSNTPTTSTACCTIRKSPATSAPTTMRMTRMRTTRSPGPTTAPIPE